MSGVGLKNHTAPMKYLWGGYKKYIIKSAHPHPEGGNGTVFMFSINFVIAYRGRDVTNIVCRKELWAKSSKDL